MFYLRGQKSQSVFNNFDKFFEALGEGSMDEIADEDGDDEETSRMSKT